MSRAALRIPACCALTLAAMISVGGCHGATSASCAMQCAPPYVMDVDFNPGTSAAAARDLLTSCTEHNPVVIRTGTLRGDSDGARQATIYTRVMGRQPRTRGLFNCLNDSGIAAAAWPN